MQITVSLPANQITEKSVSILQKDTGVFDLSTIADAINQHHKSGTPVHLTSEAGDWLDDLANADVVGSMVIAERVRPDPALFKRWQEQQAVEPK